jgi:hypothetical protein
MSDKTFNINFTIDELNMVLGALGELPAKASMSLIMNIQQQAQQQGQQAEPVVEEVEES